jgi:two-component system sensor histidine kinase/response regulator
MERREEERARVLIVDDEPSARDTLEILLAKEGYDLVFAKNGQETLTRLKALTPGPDVILLDVMMPGLDGIEVCRRIRAREEWRHIPVILITALDTKDDLVRGLDAGADEFLSKPVNGPELRARVRSMLRIKRQFDQLQAAMHLREDLSHMIVHDMRSPLTVILMTVYGVRINVTEPKALENLDTIEREARRLGAFLNDMLMLAKMQESRLVPNRSSVDVNQMVRAIGGTYSAVARSRGISLVVESPDEESWQVPLDANLFQRVLDNLMSNALKFSPPGSTITLRLEYPEVRATSQSTEPLVRVQVIDEGPGIPEEHRTRVFDKFEVLSLRKDGIRQVGLGLAFCKMAVEAHGGRIFVDANEPEGSIFTVEI